MKRYYFLLMFFFLTVCQSSFAQFYRKAHNYIGVKGGASISWMKFYPNTNPYTQLPTDASSFSGYQVGLVFRNMSEEHVGILAEINYTQKGWQEKEREGITYSRRLNYIEIPVMTHISLGKKNFRAFLNIGPSVSFLVSEEENKEITNSDTKPQNYYDVPLDRTFDFAFCGGAGLEYRFSRQAILLEGRYTLSLLNVFDDGTIGYSSSRNQNIGITLSWLYDFHK